MDIDVSGNESAASAAAGRLVAGLSMNLLSDARAGGCGFAAGTARSASALPDGLSTFPENVALSAAARLSAEPDLSMLGLIDCRDGERANLRNGSSLGTAAAGAGEKPENEKVASCAALDLSASLAAAAFAAAALSTCARRASGEGLLCERKKGETSQHYGVARSELHADTLREKEVGTCGRSSRIANLRIRALAWKGAAGAEDWNERPPGDGGPCCDPISDLPDLETNGSESSYDFPTQMPALRGMLRAAMPGV